MIHRQRMPDSAAPFRSQLLKWVGNKQKQADAIIEYFPKRFGTYFEPFLGSGGVLGVLSPERAIASDGFLPLMEIWLSLPNGKEQLKQDYADRHALIARLGKKRAYEQILESYNARPNGADLVFLCRACYGGGGAISQARRVHEHAGRHARSDYSRGLCGSRRRMAFPHRGHRISSSGFCGRDEPRRERRPRLLRSALLR